MHRFIWIFIIAISYVINLQAKTNDTVNKNLFTYFQLPTNFWKNYKDALYTVEMQQYGFTQNPGVSSSNGAKQWICEEDCDSLIAAVFMHRLVKKDLEFMDGGVIVYECKDAASFNKIESSLERLDFERFLKNGVFLIYIWNNEEDDKEREKNIQLLVKHFQKGGADLMDIPLKQITFTEDELEKARADYEEDKRHAIATNAGKKEKHIFAGEDMLIVFYNDGTLILCPDCKMDNATLSKLRNEPPYTLYLESNSGVAIQPIERGETTLIDFGEVEMGTWQMRNYEPLEKKEE